MKNNVIKIRSLLEYSMGWDRINMSKRKKKNGFDSQLYTMYNYF